MLGTSLVIKNEKKMSTTIGTCRKKGNKKSDYKVKRRR